MSSERFELIDTELSLVKLLLLKPRLDVRGAFCRFFCLTEINKLVEFGSIVQINECRNMTAGTVRGMHYQLPPYAENKLVICTSGRLYDIVIDLRTNSPTYLQKTENILDASRPQAIYIPEGHAHGYQTLDDDSVLLYINSAEYSMLCERGISPFDRDLNISWPLDVSRISDRDAKHPSARELKDEHEEYFRF